MLSSSGRFHGYSSLNWAYRHGENIRDQQVSLKYALNSRRHSFRAAVVVSRKVNRSAVVRNRIRRRIYEIVRAHEADIKGSFDLIFIVQKDEVVSLPNEELSAMITNLMKRAKVI
ncbi:MAG: ribonuclease P protein component [Candidatus Saccharimonadales bacterium]